jgi:hypothetical protein
MITHGGLAATARSSRGGSFLHRHPAGARLAQGAVDNPAPRPR